MNRRRFLAGAVATAAACGAPAVAPPPAAETAAARPTVSPPTPTSNPTSAPSSSPLQACVRDAAGKIAFVDTHAHLDGIVPGGASNYAGAAEASIAADDRVSARFAIVMPMPFPADGRGAFDVNELAPVARARPGRLAFLGGGGTLNPLIQQAAAGGATRQSQLEETASRILGEGARGFGEMAVLHLSFNANHPFEQIAADHPLFLALADIAAARDVPIDVHLDAIARDVPTPPPFPQLSRNNPPALKENIAGFERLLARNRAARIVWAHCGSDQTGHSTAALYRRLLGAHPNLFLQLKPAIPPTGRSLHPENDLLDGAGRISAAWLGLMSAFPERLVLGGDNFFAVPGAQQVFQRPPSNLDSFRAFVDQLPANLGCRVSSENAIRIYRL